VRVFHSHCAYYFSSQYSSDSYSLRFAGLGILGDSHSPQWCVSTIFLAEEAAYVGADCRMDDIPLDAFVYVLSTKPSFSPTESCVSKPAGKVSNSSLRVLYLSFRVAPRICRMNLESDGRGGEGFIRPQCVCMEGGDGTKLALTTLSRSPNGESME